MAREGRDLEKLVAILEKNLGPEGIRVTSPDYIVGKESKSRREVDITLRGQVGSTSVLIIIECRDQKGNEDVRWIEEIASKRKDVGANRAIAVSSSGFTAGAINLAQANDIELRTLEQVDPNEILLWFDFSHITGHKRQVNILHTEIQIANLEKVDVQLHPDFVNWIKKDRNTIEPVFYRKGENNPVSLLDIWWLIPQDKSYANIVPGSPKTICKITLNFPEEQYRYQLQTVDGYIEIESIDFYAELWISIEKLSLAAIKEYRNNSETVAQTADFVEFNHMGRNMIFSLHRYPEAKRQVISLRSKDDEKPINLIVHPIILNDIVKQLLVDVARNHSLISNDNLLLLTNKSIQQFTLELVTLEKTLIAISRQEHIDGRPLLSAIVTDLGLEKPSASFYEIARGLGLVGSMGDQEFYLQELQKVYNYWEEESRDAS